MTEELLFTKQDLERFKAMADALGYKNNPANTTQTANNLHGLNPSGSVGLFGGVGVDPRMYHTIATANGSYAAALPFRASQFLQVRREIVTGVNDGSGNNPGTFCGDPARPGDLTICRHDFEFAEVAASTQTVEGPRVGTYYTVADVDRSIINNAPDLGPWTPEPLNAATNVNSQSYKQMLQLAVDLNRQHARALVRGLRSATATGAGSLRYFNRQADGLDRLIRTGYRDVVSNDLCAAVDSRVINFGGNLTDTTAAHGTIVDVVTDAITGIENDLYDNMGFDEGSSAWSFVVHPRMWRPLTRQWPCAYQTTGCEIVANDGTRLNITAETQRQMQDQMYNGRYLMVDGRRIPVLFSWGVPITNVGNDLWNGSIYYVPWTLNGEQAHYVEYFDMGNAQQTEWYNLAGVNGNSRVINNGLYRMGRRDNPDCIEYTFKSMWRLLLTAPFAAFRIDNITFQDRTRTRSPFPGESYYAAGGVTSRATLS